MSIRVDPWSVLSVAQFNRNFSTNNTQAYWLKSIAFVRHLFVAGVVHDVPDRCAIGTHRPHHRFGLVERHARVLRALDDEERDLQLRGVCQRRNALQERPRFRISGVAVLGQPVTTA